MRFTSRSKARGPSFRACATASSPLATGLTRRRSATEAGASTPSCRSSAPGASATSSCTTRAPAPCPRRWPWAGRPAGWRCAARSCARRPEAARMFPIHTGRPPTMAPKCMVVSPHSLASAAGVDALRAGGSAVDAAIAAGAALCVLYPHMTSVGGDAFWLIHDARARRVRYLNGGGRAAGSASIDWFRSRGMNEVPLRGFLPATLTVPGAVASWCAAHDEYGRLPLARDLVAAIGYAREGFPVTGRLARAIELHAAENALNAHALAVFVPGGAAPRAGDKLFNRGLALVLERIATAGRGGFYEGETARALASSSEARGPTGMAEFSSRLQRLGAVRCSSESLAADSSNAAGFIFSVPK